jgi:hypothetical protein
VYYAANTSGSVIAVVLGGTSVPLPNNQIDHSPATADVVADVTNTVFTVGETGVYRLEYNVRLTTALLTGTQLLVNGAPLWPSMISPTNPANEFSAHVIVQLTAGSTVQLQLFGLLGAATLQPGAGASLTITRLGDAATPAI